jgi:hypothetical protein
MESVLAAPRQRIRFLTYTPLEEMKSVALRLYEERRDAIEAAFLLARDA